jgi:hypothetical protein
MNYTQFFELAVFRHQAQFFYMRIIKKIHRYTFIYDKQLFIINYPSKVTCL